MATEADDSAPAAAPADDAVDESSTRSRRNRPGERLYRHYPAIRKDPAHEEFGMMKDILEHDYWCDREREAQPGGWPLPFSPTDEEVQAMVAQNDAQIQAGQGEVLLDDPWINGYLTEDEIMFHEEYKPAPYLPDKVKQQMYYLYTEEGWDIKRLSQRFGVRTERVSMVLHMKRTEPDMEATGRSHDRVDEIFTQLYSGRFQDYVEEGESNDQGLNIAMLKDDQLPDDVLPKWEVPANTSKLHWRLPAVPVPPREERTFKAKYVFKDINVATGDGDALRVVDYDGTVRPASEREAASRTWRMQRWNIRRDAKKDPLDFNPIATANPSLTQVVEDAEAQETVQA